MNEPKKKNKIILWALFGIFSIYVVFGISLHRQARTIEFSDSDDYNTISKQDLLSSDFWAWKRPVTTPFFWKILRVQTNTKSAQDAFALVPKFYTLLSFISWGILAGSIAFALRKKWLKIIAFIFILSLGLSKMIFFWNWTLLSESLAFSFFALIIGLTIMLLSSLQNKFLDSKLNQILVAAGLSFFIFLWSFTRDSNAFILLGFSFLSLIFLVFRWKNIKHKMLAGFLVMFIILISLAQFYTIQLGQRWKYPFINVLGQRILTSDEHKNYFIEHGLPTDESAMRFCGQWAYTYEDGWSGLNGWLDSKARPTYLKFLISHPEYTFFEPIRHWRELVSEDWSFYDEAKVDSKWQNQLTIFAWPREEYLIILAILSVILTLMTAYIYGISSAHLFALALFILSIAGLLSIWHGDVIEIIRHSAGSNIQLRLALFMMIVFSLDALNLENAQKRINKKIIYQNETKIC